MITTQHNQSGMEHDGGQCQDCAGTEDLTIDHKITPWSLGGSSTDPTNLQVLCRSRNSRKGACQLES
jgi:5-methylcytosine-specific restriction endonuclease McrA